MSIEPLPGQARPLTPTSYAILGVLALRDHTTYELAKQFRVSLQYLWPRATSNLYAEPKRLVEAGLATARTERTGDRTSTVYAITEAGREALARWVGAPSSAQRYESEALLKVFFGEHGSEADALAAIESLRAEAAAGLAHWQEIADTYAAGAGEYPARFARSALVARLLAEHQLATTRWAAWAAEVVSEWGDPGAGEVGWGIETLRATGAAFDAKDEPLASRATERGCGADASGVLRP